MASIRRMPSENAPFCSAGKRPRAVILGTSASQLVESEVERLTPLIEKHVDIALCDLEAHDNLEVVEADLAIVFGGDGSILRAAHRMGYRQLTVLGCNLGRLGFLAAFTTDELLNVLSEICSGKFTVVEHLMFECHTEGGKVLHKQLGLNETAVFADRRFTYSISSFTLTRFL
jgi:NAD+ kinase